MKYPEKVIAAFLTKVKTADIARETGLTAQTIRKYKQDPELQQIIRERQDELVSAAVASMRGYLNEATLELIEIIKDKNTPVQTRVNAIQLLMKQCSDWVSTEDILKQIETLQATSNEIKENLFGKS